MNHKKSIIPYTASVSSTNGLNAFTRSIVYTILVQLLVVSGCASLFQFNDYSLFYNCTTASCLNQGLLDLSPVDSSKFEKKLEQFYSSIDTSTRTTEIVTTALNKIRNSINDGLITTLRVDTVKTLFDFVVYPDGSCRINHHTFPTMIDSTALQNLNKYIASNIERFPVIQGYHVIRNITVLNDSVAVDSLNVYCAGTGGRSKKSIMDVVMQHLDNMRIAYNRRLRQKNGIKGKITVKFAIDHYGEVIFTKVMSSTANDPLMEEAINDQIRQWKFEPIVKIGDVTEVVYPFVFSQ